MYHGTSDDVYERGSDVVHKAISFATRCEGVEGDRSIKSSRTC